jgi:WhiB family redox-sensing transcriptional regulator
MQPVILDVFPDPVRLPRQFRLSSEDHREETPKDWMMQGACTQVDPEMFFPVMGGSVEPARKICEGCDVRERCLEWALKNDEHYGVWGGKSERERRKMVRPSHRAAPRHGTLSMYKAGCHNPATCPRDPETGLSCSDARREYYARRLKVVSI